MIRNYFKIAWRNLLKNRIYSTINILGLAIGMAVTIIIALWVNDELSYNNYFKNKDKIAQVFQTQTFNGNIGTGSAIPRPLDKAMREEFNDQFEHIIMSSWGFSYYLKYDDTNISRIGNSMQEGAPDMLDLKIIKGVKDGITETHSIMLSKSTAETLFGDEEPIGKIIKVNNEYSMKVTAIYQDIPNNNSFENLDFLLPWKHYITTQDWIKDAEDQWGNNSWQLFVQLKENAQMDKVSDMISDLKMRLSGEEKEFKPTLFLLPMKDWYLRSNFVDGIQQGGRIEYVWLFAIIGIFVLLLACINFMNLSTARSEKRSKEVGVRKSIGSTRIQLVRQFLTESLLIVLFAFVIAIVLVLVSLKGFNTLSSKEIDFPWFNISFWLVSLFFVMLTALLSGSYPALYLSSFKPVRVLKGTFKAGKLAAIPRKILVVAQFTVSIALIMGTMVIQKQIVHTKDRPIGYNKSGLVQIPTFSNAFQGKYDLMRSEFLKSEAITEMSSSSSPVTNVWSNRGGWTWDGKPDSFQEDFAWVEVSPEYAKSLSLKIIAGRDFSREFATDSTAVLINKSAVKYMGIQDPIGLKLRPESSEPEDPRVTLTIIGVVDDIIMQSPYEPVKQTVFSFDTEGNSSYYNLRLNPEKSVSQSISLLEGIFKKHFPNLPFSYDFVDEDFGEKFASEERVANLAGIFTGLAILISCLGLFGLASFVAEQRTKEIGIRKVLGASIFNLWKMLSTDFVQLVLISCILAVPIAYYFMNNWLQNYEYRTEIKIWIVMGAVLGALGIAMLTVSFQAIKAAISNPIKSLRTE